MLNMFMPLQLEITVACYTSISQQVEQYEDPMLHHWKRHTELLQTLKQC